MLISATDLLARIVPREDSSIELREVGFRGSEVGGPGLDQLADELAAFANGRGGTLVLGADDESREILGIPLEKLDSVTRLVTKVCLDRIDPPLDATTQKLPLPDSAGISQWVVRVNVERSLSVHRSPGGYFHRVGSSKRKMAQDQLRRLFEQRSRDRLIRFDATVVPGTDLSHLDAGLLERFRTDRTLDSERTLAVKLGMAGDDGSDKVGLTVAGVLMGTVHPEKWLRHAFIQAVAYRGNRIGIAGTDETHYQIDAKDIFGPLDVQVAEACRFVARNQRVSARKVLGRTDCPQYDMTAVFEAVVNAVAHRDYSMLGSKVRMRMFSNRLELYSPGELVSTMTPETLASGQATRNEVIASLMAKCSVPEPIPWLHTTRTTLMDRRGEGVPLILERSEVISGRRPVYESPDESELRLTVFGADVGTY